MSWNPYTIAGLAQESYQDFEYRSNDIALSGDGSLSQSGVEGDYTYDDTAWGNVPNGIFKTLATCAVNPDPPPSGTWYSGKYVQPYLGFVSSMGADMTRVSSGSNGGAVTAFHLSMAGFGALHVANENDGSDYIVSLPLVGDYSPYVYLLRPTTLAWDGQDPTNEANRTIWLYNEIGVVSFGFSVVSNSVTVNIDMAVQGWTTLVPTTEVPPRTPTTIRPGSPKGGLVKRP